MDHLVELELRILRNECTIEINDKSYCHTTISFITATFNMHHLREFPSFLTYLINHARSYFQPFHAPHKQSMVVV